MKLDDPLFRRESVRMVAALVHVFGIHNLALAEDVVQDAFCRALERWEGHGMPDNPGAWLVATAASAVSRSAWEARFCSLRAFVRANCLSALSALACAVATPASADW